MDAHVMCPLERMTRDAHVEAYSFVHLEQVSRHNGNGEFKVFKSIPVSYHEYLAFYGFTSRELVDMKVPPWW